MVEEKMEDYKHPEACSGFVTVEEGQKFIQAAPQPDNRTYQFSSWATAPAQWPIKEDLMVCADYSYVKIEIQIEQVGWIFKRNKYYFKVTGTKDNVDTFRSRFIKMINTYQKKQIVDKGKP